MRYRLNQDSFKFSLLWQQCDDDKYDTIIESDYTTAAHAFLTLTQIKLDRLA